LKPAKINSIDRIIDANINRAQEGLRVCEEITRFILNNRFLTEALKKIRHRITLLLERTPARINLIKERYSLKDVGLGIYIKDEFKRTGYQDIFFANMQRVKESIRVLEEFSKLKNIDLAARIKKLRYDIYEIEKKVAQKISGLHNHR
jgi:thiamine-phosphate pyrophosphorylase